MRDRTMLLLAGSLVLAGCGGDRSDRPVVTRTDAGASSAPAGTEAAGRGRSLVRLVNAMPAARNIDVSGGDRTVFTDVAYRDVTPYTEIAGNLVTFRLRAAGGDSVLADNHEVLTDGYRYTLVSLPDRKGDPELRILKDELAPDPGVARLRVVNAAEGLGTVDVRLSGRKDPLFRDVTYGAEVGYTDLAPGEETVSIVSQAPGHRTVELSRTRFEGGRTYTIVVAGWERGRVETITFDDGLRHGGAGLSLGARP